MRSSLSPSPEVNSQPHAAKPLRLTRALYAQSLTLSFYLLCFFVFMIHPHLPLWSCPCYGAHILSVVPVIFCPTSNYQHFSRTKTSSSAVRACWNDLYFLLAPPSLAVHNFCPMFLVLLVFSLCSLAISHRSDSTGEMSLIHLDKLQ